MSRPIPDEEKEIQKSQKPSPVTGKTSLIYTTIQKAHPLKFVTLISIYLWCWTHNWQSFPWPAGASKSYGDLELHQRSSKSLLANVLDLDDNALASHNNLLNNVYSTPGPHHAHTMGHGHSHIHTTPHHHHSHAPTTPHHQHATSLPHSSYPGHQISHTPHHHPHSQDTSTPQVETILQNACFCARYELVLILKEIKVKTSRQAVPEIIRVLRLSDLRIFLRFTLRQRILSSWDSGRLWDPEIGDSWLSFVFRSIARESQDSDLPGLKLVLSRFLDYSSSKLGNFKNIPSCLFSPNVIQNTKFRKSSLFSGELLIGRQDNCFNDETISFQIITNQLKTEEENTKITNDWKFAAMVIDRMCLIIFTLFTIIATITVLLSAPHIIVTWFRKASLPPVVPGPTRTTRRIPASASPSSSTGIACDALPARRRPPLTGHRRSELEAARLRVRIPLRFGDLRVRKKAIRGVTSFLYDIHNGYGKDEDNNTIDNESNDNSINNNYVIIIIATG